MDEITYKYDVFISYSRKDEEEHPLAHRLYKDLKSAGKKIWWDKKHMPSRGVAFPVELRSAIWDSERLIAVIGPNALHSKYVWSEWSYAYTFSRAIVPVLRNCQIDRIGDDQALVFERDRRAEFTAPFDEQKLKQINYIDFTDNARYQASLEELLQKLSDPLQSVGPILGRPPAFPPPNFIPRQKVVAALENIGLVDRMDPRSLSREQRIFIVHGTGGSGKTVLANAAANSMQVRWSFPDGIVWIPMQRPFSKRGDLISTEIRCLTAFKRFASAFRYCEGLSGDERVALDLILQAKEAADAEVNAKKLLKGKSRLVILDDVWESEDPQPFINILNGCSLCITTRNKGIVADLSIPNSGVLSLGEESLLMTKEEAKQLLADWAGEDVEKLPQVAQKVIDICERLPLALAICGAMVRRGGMRWAQLPQALLDAEKVVLRRKIPAYCMETKINVFTPIQASLDNLRRLDRESELSGDGETWRLYDKYLDLSVVHPEVETPEGLIFALWTEEHGRGGFGEAHARDLTAEYANLALLRQLATECQHASILLHQLCSVYLASIDEDRRTRLLGVFGRGLYYTWANRKLFALGRRVEEREWTEVVEYCRDKLFGHLVDGECWDELGWLLGDPGYLDCMGSKERQFELETQIIGILQTDGIPHGEILLKAHDGIAKRMELGIPKADWFDIFAYWLNEFGKANDQWRSSGIEKAALKFDVSCARASESLVGRFAAARDYDSAVRFAELRAWACQRARRLDDCVEACEAAEETFALEGIEEGYRVLGGLEFIRMRARALRSLAGDLDTGSEPAKKAARAYEELSAGFSRIEPGCWNLSMADWWNLENDEEADFDGIAPAQAGAGNAATALVVSNAHDALGAMYVIQCLQAKGYRVEWVHHRHLQDARERLKGKSWGVLIGGPKAPGISALAQEFRRIDREKFLEMYSGLHFGPKELEATIEGANCVMLGGVSKAHTLLAAYNFIKNRDLV